MARFYSITLRAEAFTTAVVNTFWYRQDGVGLPTEGDLQALMDAFNQQRMPNWLLAHTTPYKMVQWEIQGYSDQWQRAPYLPLVVPDNRIGGDGTSSAPPITALVLGCKVVPRVLARRKRPDGSIYQSPVRRSYWSISPVNETIVGPDGFFTESGAATGLWANIRTEHSQPLSVSGWPDNPIPVVVSSPLKDEVARGYGEIKACYWNKAVSTRRSRKLKVQS